MVLSGRTAELVGVKTLHNAIWKFYISGTFYFQDAGSDILAHATFM